MINGKNENHPSFYAKEEKIEQPIEVVLPKKEKKEEKVEEPVVVEEKKEKLSFEELYDLTKSEQVDALEKLGLSKDEIKKLKKEKDRVEKLFELSK